MVIHYGLTETINCKESSNSAENATMQYETIRDGN